MDIASRKRLFNKFYFMRQRKDTLHTMDLNCIPLPSAKILL